jgi:hypothetical protein
MCGMQMRPPSPPNFGAISLWARAPPSAPTWELRGCRAVRPPDIVTKPSGAVLRIYVETPTGTKSAQLDESILVLQQVQATCLAKEPFRLSTYADADAVLKCTGCELNDNNITLKLWRHNAMSVKELWSTGVRRRHTADDSDWHLDVGKTVTDICSGSLGLENQFDKISRDIKIK